jgi:hypothetical protein
MSLSKEYMLVICSPQGKSKEGVGINSIGIGSVVLRLVFSECFV